MAIPCGRGHLHLSPNYRDLEKLITERKLAVQGQWTLSVQHLAICSGLLQKGNLH